MSETIKVPSWLDRVCESLKDQFGGERDSYMVLFEAYSEMQTVKLKIALARCYEVIQESKSSDKTVNLEQGFIEGVYALFTK